MPAQLSPVTHENSHSQRTAISTRGLSCTELSDLAFSPAAHLGKYPCPPSPAARWCLATAPPFFQVTLATSPRLIAGTLAGPHWPSALQTLRCKTQHFCQALHPFYPPHPLTSFKCFST